MTKKLICALLCVLLCTVAFTGCSDDGIPDGMFSSTIEGEPFILYVPDGWTDNCDSGISSAYYGLNVIATARYYVPKSANETLESFVDSYIAELSTDDAEFSYERKSSKLGKDAKAERIEYDFDREAEQNGEKVTSKAKAIQYIAQHDGGFVMLSFYCESSAFEEYAESFEKIRAEFVLCEGDVFNDVVTDKRTPEGMKIASGDLEYRFYVPNSWVTNLSDGFSSAYYPEPSRPNVTVTAYSLSAEMTVDKYFEFCEEEYKKELSDYELISRAERKVHDINAVSFTYKTVYGETEIKTMQTVFIYNDLAYSITYTAHADRFDTHIGDVNKMLDEFRFR